MPASSIDLKTAFVGRRLGEGVVLGLTGKTLGRFSIEFFGEWSIGHDALHLDEKVAYADGRSVERHWAVQFDSAGALVGYDSHQAARIRAQRRGSSVRVLFDRPNSFAPRIAAPRVVVDVAETPEGHLQLDGRTAVLGVALQQARATLRRP